MLPAVHRGLPAPAAKLWLGAVNSSLSTSWVQGRERERRSARGCREGGALIVWTVRQRPCSTSDTRPAPAVCSAARLPRYTSHNLRCIFQRCRRLRVCQHRSQSCLHQAPPSPAAPGSCHRLRRRVRQHRHPAQVLLHMLTAALEAALAANVLQSDEIANVDDLGGSKAIPCTETAGEAARLATGRSVGRHSGEGQICQSPPFDRLN